MTQPPGPDEEQPQAGDVPPPDPHPPMAPPPTAPQAEYPPSTGPQAEYPPSTGPQAEYPPMAPAPMSEYGQSGYAAVPPGMWYDQESGLMLPQGTELASVGRRIGAYFLAIPLAIVTLGIGYIIWGMIVWANGQTPALQVLGMRVWRPETGRVATWWWMALREVVGRIADGIVGIFSELTSFIMMLATKERKALHDFIAGTVVLRDPGNVLANRPPEA